MNSLSLSTCGIVQYAFCLLFFCFVLFSGHFLTCSDLSHTIFRYMKDMPMLCLLFKKFLMFIFERETQNPKQAPGSGLSAQSPTRGSNPHTVRS